LLPDATLIRPDNLSKNLSRADTNTLLRQLTNAEMPNTYQNGEGGLETGYSELPLRIPGSETPFSQKRKSRRTLNPQIREISRIRQLARILLRNNFISALT
jgi:hypothetical protein